MYLKQKQYVNEKSHLKFPSKNEKKKKTKNQAEEVYQ